MDGLVLWQTTWTLALIVLLTVAALRLLPKHWPLSLAWSYFLTLCLWASFRPFRLLTISPLGHTKLAESAGQAFAELLLVPLFFLLMKESWMRGVRWVLVGVAVLDACLVWYNGWGILWATTFDAAFICMTLPLVPWYVGVFFIVTAVKAKSLTAFTVVLAQALVLLFHRFSWRGGLALAGVLGAFGAGLLWRGKTLYFGWERLAMWKSFHHWWQGHVNHWVGSGGGTFQWMAPAIREYQGTLYAQAHNDWYQIHFEYGAIGVALAVGAYVYLFWNASSHGRVLLAGVGACMMTYYPLHFFPTAVVCAYVARGALNAR